MKKKIAFVSGWYNFGGNQGISDDYRFMTNCLYESAKKYFLPNHDVEFIFMNNSNVTIDGVTNINFEYKIDNFWHMCLMKILSLRYLKDEYDYIFINDNDQIYIKEVGDEILETDFTFLDHWFKPTTQSIHREVTDIVELNFDTTKNQWTMGNFFGGKQKNVLELLEITEENHKKYFGHNYNQIHFYTRYPEEIFTLKYVYENNINHKRLNCSFNPLDTKEEVFLGDFSKEESDHFKIKNTKLLHDTKKNLEKLKKIFQKPKIAVCQFYTSNVSYGEYAEKINKKYCEDNGYFYFVEKDGEKIKNKLDGRSWTWYKPHLIKEVFETYEDCDYVLFLDIDAIFCNNNRKIENFITDDFSILMTEDYGPSMVNAGVILLKNDDFSKKYLSDWWDICEEYPNYKTGLWHDQTCIGLLYPRLENKEKFKVIQNFDFNARNYSDDVFIFHAFSFGNLKNRTIDSIYYKKFNITPSNNKDLNELGSFYGTDKEYHHNYYTRFYKKILEPKQSKCDILEIGNANNTSLKVWKDFFNEGCVHGIHINKDNIDDERIKTFIVDHSNEEDIINFSNLGYKYDVIVDDGSHRMKDQQITAQLLFKNIKDGGMLIIEDLQTSIECRMPEKQIFGWGDPQKTTCLDMLQSIIDKSPKTDYVTKEWEYFCENIEFIEISKDRDDSIYAIIKKKGNTKKKTKVVYHCYLVGDWKEVVSGQLKRLKESGLYEYADNIFVTVNIGDSSKEEFSQFVSEYSKLEISFNDGNNAEYPGIKKVREVSLLDDSYVLYFHTKGVSNTYNDLNSKTYSQEKVQNIKSWKECMEYFVIDKWEECIELLRDNDNVGVTCNNNWYWGNFWWSQTNHIQKTEPVGVWGRWDYEAWLNRGVQNVKNYQWFKFNYNPYLTNISEDWYKIERRFSGDKIVLHNAFYGMPKFQIDEGYSISNLNQGKDVTDVVRELLKKENNLQFNFNVNNDTMGGDPLPGVKKFLMVEFSPESNLNKIYKIGIEEEQNFNYHE